MSVHRIEAWGRRGAALAVSAGLSLALVSPAAAQIAVRGRIVHTQAGPPLADGVVVVSGARIAAVGPAATTPIPEGYRVIEAAVVTPGLIDARSVVGLSGLLNQKQDQDQLERSAPLQPELRALDAYNPLDPLVAWVRGFGVTTLHTGHAPGETISGQTMIVKTAGRTVDAALVREPAALAVSLGPIATKDEGKPPGTRGKQAALLRAELVRAQEYRAKRRAAAGDAPLERNLRLEALARALDGELPLLVYAQRAQDIATALRLAQEFGVRIWLEGAAESYLLLPEIERARVPVIVHPTMARAWGELENASFETAATLRRAGIPVAFQSGYESYVPKTRVVLFEASAAVAHGLPPEQALAMLTIDAARILGIADRVGSLEAGKDADLALYDGDPLEYTSHCLGVLVGGEPYLGRQ
jgi:imidazolonepropionase-like amidohydrolase